MFYMTSPLLEKASGGCPWDLVGYWGPSQQGEEGPSSPVAEER